MNSDQLLDTKAKICGPIFPIPTPFKENGDIDWLSLESYVQFLIDGGARVIHVMVHTSRFPLLTEPEMLEVNRVVAETAKSIDPDCVVIVADPWMCSTRTTIGFAEQAHQAGADVIGLIYGERCYKEKDVFDHFQVVSEAVPDIGLLLHEQALFTIHGTRLMEYPMSLLNDIADLPNMIAMKEDSKDDVVTRDCLKTVGDRLSIIVSGGSKEQFLKFYDDGMPAYLVGVGSFAPKIAVEFYQNLKAGNRQQAQDMIVNYEQPFFEVSKRIGWHIGLKSALDHLGIMKAYERSPLKACSSEEHREIADVMKSCGLL